MVARLVVCYDRIKTYLSFSESFLRCFQKGYGIAFFIAGLSLRDPPTAATQATEILIKISSHIHNLNNSSYSYFDFYHPTPHFLTCHHYFRPDSYYLFHIRGIH